MKIERDERRFDFHDIGLAIKRAREAAGMTQEQLAYIVDRAPRTIMYNENDGQHPSFNTFYQMVTMFDISVDQGVVAVFAVILAIQSLPGTVGGRSNSGLSCASLSLRDAQMK